MIGSEIFRRPSLLQALLRPGARQVNDRSAAAEHNWSRFRDTDLPPGLQLQWLGAAGFRMSYQGTDLLIDPYFSRPGLGRVLRREALHGSLPAVSRYVERADAVLVGHTHFDHVMDVPRIARGLGCSVYGSQSLARLMKLHDLGERAVEIDLYRVYEIGPFEIRFVPSVHSKLLLGLRIPAEGELSCEHLDDLSAGQYRCGQVYGIRIDVAGTSFYHQGSANLIDDAIPKEGIDFFLAGIAGRGFTPSYWQRILGRLSPRVIVPHHHDNFFLPLDQPMGFSLNVNFGGFVEEIHSVSADFRIRSLDLLQTIGG